MASIAAGSIRPFCERIVSSARTRAAIGSSSLSCDVVIMIVGTWERTLGPAVRRAKGKHSRRIFTSLRRIAPPVRFARFAIVHPMRVLIWVGTADRIGNRRALAVGP